MTALLIAVLASLRATTRSRLALAAEILALRHQRSVLQRTTPIPDHVLLTSTEPACEGRAEYLKGGNGNNHGGASLLH
jgi:hypothetical protein